MIFNRIPNIFSFHIHYDHFNSNYPHMQCVNVCVIRRQAYSALCGGARAEHKTETSLAQHFNIQLIYDIRSNDAVAAGGLALRSHRIDWLHKPKVYRHESNAFDISFVCIWSLNIHTRIHTTATTDNCRQLYISVDSIDANKYTQYQ